MRNLHRHRLIAATLYFLAVACSPAICADVAYIDVPTGQPYTRQQVESAAQIYGLDVRAVLLAVAGDEARATAAIEDAQTVAVVVTAEALRSFDRDHLLSVLRKAKRPRPLMIVGITDQTDPHLLRAWSSGAVVGCVKSPMRQSEAYYEVAGANEIARELSGARLPLSDSDVQILVPGTANGGEWLIAAIDGRGRHPVLARTTSGGQDTFFAVAPANARVGLPADLFRQPEIFVTLAPQLLFLRYAAGEKGWHTPGHYGNLTIDDLWLREPYGHVQYRDLLREMQQHNFHTTVAFIPWNYDRSQSALVDLFKEHQDRFSICVHGNNHDHQEFGPADVRPLEGQRRDIKQGLARMAALHTMTGLSFDPVMVFPHKVSPQETFAYLKRYNFWATVNASNVPSDVVPPSDPEFALRVTTQAFRNFPSLRRYSAEHPIPDWQLAMDAFLGNPTLFYAHEAFFATGIDAFSRLADKVNRLQPDTQWVSLGAIAQHLYLQRVRDDGNYDVRLLSGVAQLRNDRERDVVLFLEKDENGDAPLTVLVDHQPQPYQLVDGRLRLQLTVAAGMTRNVSIRYQNDLDLSKIDISKSSLRVAALRYLSDFRDNEVSRTSLGRWFIGSYIEYRSLWNAMATVAGLLILLAAYSYLRRHKRRQIATRSSFAPRRS